MKPEVVTVYRYNAYVSNDDGTVDHVLSRIVPVESEHTEDMLDLLVQAVVHASPGKCAEITVEKYTRIDVKTHYSEAHPMYKEPKNPTVHNPPPKRERGWGPESMTQ